MRRTALLQPIPSPRDSVEDASSCDSMVRLISAAPVGPDPADERPTMRVPAFSSLPDVDDDLSRGTQDRLDLLWTEEEGGTARRIAKSLPAPRLGAWLETVRTNRERSLLAAKAKVPCRIQSLRSLPRDAADHVMAFLLGFIDGERTVEELLVLSPMPVREVIAELNRLIDSRIIELVDAETRDQRETMRPAGAAARRRGARRRGTHTR